MTTYIPSLTLPAQVFTNPALAVLTPIVLGTAVGFGVSRTSTFIFLLSRNHPLTRPEARNTQGTYMALKQPKFRPPPWLFGPAWTLLYGLMGYASHRALTTGLDPLSSAASLQNAKHGATLYSIQLGLNYLWMPLFFGLKKPKAAAVDILALGGTVAYLTYVWAQVDSVAAWCLAPYLGWLGFATYLNFGVGMLNDWDFEGKTVEKSPKDKSHPTKNINEKSE